MKKLIILSISILVLTACSSLEKKDKEYNIFSAERILPQISVPVGEKLIYEGKFVWDKQDFNFHFIIKTQSPSVKRVVAINEYGSKVLDGNFTNGSFSLTYISPEYEDYIAQRFEMIVTYLLFPPTNLKNDYYAKKMFTQKFTIEDGFLYYYHKKYEPLPFKMEYTHQARIKGEMFFNKYENTLPIEMVYQDAIFPKLVLEFKLTDL
ncbi:MAG: hypothetical protein HOF38_02840 [Elusimicrobiaceae bacterium]|nr:hypothetical protein [Elusimicrobiaceae bacterium]MBT3955077.1 hypothetical protein [Elusimicrobiaceae bacterium]MBT4007990.1 hypothetical protein [Elusimicrobiaceae bacterium]MBT4402899.1 hypothetical protein [Elusimicrobiaceae bacterium]MBT4439472.1 hypothetical protein [Elusimicrobiaceae bacterium]